METGQEIGHYRIEGHLGRGGMGDVWVAFDKTLERRVALKAIRPENRLDAHSRARFLQEARILSQLDHPNICRIHGYVEMEGRDFLVLELIDGEPLGEAIRRGLDRSRAMEIAEKLARVLVEAHAAGVVHRDLKPDNVMLQRSGEPKVLDFGLARPLHAAEDSGLAVRGLREAPDAPSGGGDTVTIVPSGMRTEAGTISGTPMFMSPEQAACESVSAASDMYSFGLLLQVLFTGERPYEPAPDLAGQLEAVRQARTLPVRGLDPHLCELIERLKSRAPGARPTAAETADRLGWIRDKPKRRARKLAVAAVLVVLGAGTLKYTLDLREARDVAVRRRAQAEDLIDFMLGDLRAKLEPVGRLEVLDDVGRKALDYFASVPEAELTPNELFRRSRALGQLGQVRSAQGDLAGALDAFQGAFVQAQELVRRDPDNGEWRAGLGQGHFWIGFVAWRRGDLDTAVAEFERYREIAEGLVAGDPRNPELRHELGYAHSNIGSVLEARGDLDGALAQYRRCLEIEHELAAADPDDAELQLELAASYNAVGNVLAERGEPAAALENHLADLAIKQRLVATDPANTTWRGYFAVSHNLTGHLLRDAGRAPEALAHFIEAASIMRELAELDPTNAGWSRELAVNLSGEATVLLALHRGDEAIARLSRARVVLAELVAREPTDAGLKRDLARILAKDAEALVTAGRPVEGAERATAALALADELLAQDPRDRDAASIRSEAHEARGHAWSRQGHPARAREAWTAALEAIEPLARVSADRRILGQWSRVLLRLDRLEEARPVVARVVALGYRDVGLLELCYKKGLKLEL